MAIALGLLGLLASVPASAGEPVIVAPARTEGDVSDAVRTNLEQRLFEVVSKSEVRIVEVAEPLGQRASGCKSDRCRADLIAEAGATFLLVPEIALVDEDYQLGVTLYGARGIKTARLQEVCALCGLAEAGDVMADIGARIGRKVDVATRASLVEVRSDPAGAMVFLGDELIGTTPFEFPMESGRYELRVELEGYIGQRRTIEVVAGESKELDLGLQPVPVAASGPKDRSKGLVIGGAATLVFGLAAAGGGAGLMVIDQRPIESKCSGSDVDIEGNCRYRYSTLEAGIGLVAGGVALVGTGVALLVVGRKRTRHAQSARLRPRWGGLALEF